MPKDRKHKRNQGLPATLPAGSGQTSADDDDKMSIASDKTESTVQLSDGDDGISEIEAYEAKVLEAMDLASEKSVQTRTNAMTSLTTALQKRVLSNFLLDHYQTMCDLVDRSLKKGKGAEQVAAARLGSLLILSLSHLAEAEEIYKTLLPTLTVVVTDPSASLTGRQEVALTLAITTFLACHDIAEVTAAMKTLHSVFGGSLPKGNGELPNHPAATTSLHTSALNGFCLLLCLLSPTDVYSMANKLIKEMYSLLECNDVDLRIQAGEAVALIYESARLHDEDYYWEKEGELCAALKELATDSHKYRAKKDRKQQRASFRDVVKTVEEGDVPTETINIGPQHQRQELLIDTWSLRWQYSFLCHTLNIGLSTHTTYNIGVRDMFELGPPPIQADRALLAQARRSQKKINRESPSCKARHLNRNKNRDNRAAAKAYDD